MVNLHQDLTERCGTAWHLERCETAGAHIAALLVPEVCMQSLPAPQTDM